MCHMVNMMNQPKPQQPGLQTNLRSVPTATTPAPAPVQVPVPAPAPTPLQAATALAVLLSWYVQRQAQDADELLEMSLAQIDETTRKMHKAVQRESHHIDYRVRNSGDEVRERLVNSQRRS